MDQTRLNSSLPFLSVFLCSAKPDTICSSGGNDTCFSPLLLFFWFSSLCSAVSSLCSSFSLSLQWVIPLFTRSFHSLNFKTGSARRINSQRRSCVEPWQQFLILMERGSSDVHTGLHICTNSCMQSAALSTLCHLKRRDTKETISYS